MSLRNGFLRLLLITACAGAPLVCAQEQPAVKSTQSNRVLVLKSGRVVRGAMRPRGNGYDIDLPKGQMFVGSTQIWLMADSLPEAHQLMRDSFRSLTPDIHMQIAVWCADNQLWGTARRELLDALHLDPHREEARRMLANVVRRQQLASEPPKEQESSAVREAIAMRTVMPRRSLGGLPPELAGEFTQRIQPLLSNRCAQCHRPGSDRQFIFRGIRRGSTPQIAEENLTSILAQLETSADGSGSFLTMATTRHGGMKSDPLPGRNGAAQQQRLTAWLQRVQQATGQTVTQTRSPEHATSGIRHAGYRGRGRRDTAVMTADYSSTGATSGIMTPADQQTTHRTAARDLQPHRPKAHRPEAHRPAADRDAHERTRSVEQVEATVLADAHRRNRDDPFDPEIFNRLYRVRSVSTDTPAGRTYRRKP